LRWSLWIYCQALVKAMNPCMIKNTQNQSNKTKE
jgi:hypothetical protein